MTQSRESEKYQIASLAKGLSVLALFSERRTEMMLKEFVEETGIPMPTVFRILSTLEATGYVERLDSGTFRPGVKVLDLGFAALGSLDVVQVSRPLLQELVSVTERTVNLGVLVGDRVLYLARLPNADLVTESLQVGSTLPATCTSMGKQLLSALSLVELDRAINDGSFPEGSGPDAVKTRAELDKALEKVRKDGYAVQDQEVSPRLRSVAIGVRDSPGRLVAAVNIALPASEATVEELLETFLQPLQETCEKISLRLGYRGA